MATFFRIDEWNKSGNGSEIHFEHTPEDAMSWVAGMRPIMSNETDGIEHTSIQQFDSETCDMNGWNNSNANETTPHNFA